METTTIIIPTQEVGDVTIKRLHVGDYIRAVKVIKSFWPKVRKLVPSDTDLNAMSREDFLLLIPDLIETAEPELLDLLARFTDKTGDDMALLDLAEALDVIDAALELNSYDSIAKNVKKVWGRINTQSLQTELQKAKEPTPTNG